MSLSPSTILQWDVRSWSKALRFWEENVDWQKIEHCLELGAREGGLSLWLAEKGKRVICSDLEHTEEAALPHHLKFSFHTLISYQDINATDIPYENEFDLIVFKSIVGGIGRNNDKLQQQNVFSTAYKALKPGGVLLFAENLPGSFVHRFFRKRFTKWSAYWRYPSLSEFSEFTSSYSKVTLKTNGFLGTFGRSERQRNFLSFFDRVLFDHIIPTSRRYIVYGICHKPNQN
jgi:SAM-dependent methyltransferase